MLNVATESAASAPMPPIEPADVPAADTRYADYKIIRRNGAVVGFAPNKIAIAVTKAFIAVQGGQAAASARIRELVESITSQVTAALMRRNPNGGTFHIEDIQDQVELALMRSGEHEVARAYVLYREKRAQERAAQKAAGVPEVQLHVIEGRPAGRRLHRPRRQRQGRADHAHRAARPLRRRADGRSRKGAGAGRALDDRAGPGLFLRHRPPAAQLDPP